MSSAKRVYLDYRIPKNSGSRHSDFYNEQVRAGHPCELFIQDDSYGAFVLCAKKCIFVAITSAKKCYTFTETSAKKCN